MAHIDTVSAISGCKNSIQANNIKSTGIENNYFISICSREEQPIWFNVREPVKCFTGRIRELQKLHEEMKRNQNEDRFKLTVISQIASISGLGGIGKSELARKYAHEESQAYAGNVIWINAENYGTLSDSFIRLAKDKLNILTKSSDGKEKAIQSIVEEVYQHFTHKKSLFIFDNAEKYRTQQDGDEGIDKFLPICLPPEANKPFIIITSRNRHWEDQIAILPLGTFTIDEAIAFIKQSLKIVDTSQRAQMQQLADKLQCFPLALQQAVAYIREQNEILKNIDPEETFEISDYLKFYQEEAEKLLDFSFPDDSSDGYTKTTFITWQVTLETIKKKDAGQLALDILDIMAYFSPDRITAKLFLAVIENGQKAKLGAAIQLLKQYSMVDQIPGELSVHRLVQHVIRLCLKKQEKEEMTLKKALALLNNALDETHTEKTSYIPHALSVWNHASHHRALVEEFSIFPNRIIDKLVEAGRYQDAYTVTEQALEQLQHVLGLENLSTIMVQHNMAKVLYHQGRYEESRKLHQVVYEKQKELLGPDHVDTLDTQNNIAAVLYYQGQYNEAIKLYQMVYEKRREQLGSDHRDTLAVQNNIALVLDCLGRYEEALKMYQAVCEKLKDRLGSDHPDTLMVQNNIALVLYNQGQYEEAFQLYQVVYEKRKEKLGFNHPDSLWTQYNIANVLNKQGRYEESFKLFQVVYEKQKEHLGSDHPDTLFTQNDIANVLNKQGQYEEALKLYQVVYEKRKEQLGFDHPDTLETQSNIALVLHNRGQYAEALKLYQVVYEKRKEKLGSDHPDTLKTRDYASAFEYELEKQKQS